MQEKQKKDIKNLLPLMVLGFGTGAIVCIRGYQLRDGEAFFIGLITSHLFFLIVIDCLRMPSSDKR